LKECFTADTGCLQRIALILSYRVSTIKGPDFEGVLEVRRCYFSGVTGLLRTTEFHIPSRKCTLSHAQPLRRTNGAQVEVYRFLNQAWDVVEVLFVNDSVFPEQTKKQTPWPLVRERTIPNERPPLVDEI
jgi:hypothetical protein